MKFRPGPLNAQQAEMLNQLSDKVDRLLQMKGVDPVNVNWNNGIPVIMPTPGMEIPILVSGYSSGLGTSGQGVYWFQEQEYDFAGQRQPKSPGQRGYVTRSGSAIYSGDMASGIVNSSGFAASCSGILSGIPVNPLYETNARVIASNQFPYYGWARRRSQTNVQSGPGQTLGAAYEFDYGISGSAGGGLAVVTNSGPAINTSGTVNNGVTRLVIYYYRTASFGGGEAQIVPCAAQYNQPGIVDIDDQVWYRDKVIWVNNGGGSFSSGGYRTIGLQAIGNTSQVSVIEAPTELNGTGATLASDGTARLWTFSDAQLWLYNHSISGSNWSGALPFSYATLGQGDAGLTTTVVISGVGNAGLTITGNTVITPLGFSGNVDGMIFRISQTSYESGGSCFAVGNSNGVTGTYSLTSGGISSLVVVGGIIVGAF